MLRISTSLASGLVLTLAATSAFADDATTVHEFAALDRASGATGAGADLGFVFDTSGGDAGGFASRLDLHGEYVDPHSGFGAYGAIGISRAFLSSSDPLTSMLVDQINADTGLTALELGGQFHRALSGGLGIIAHVGVALPTASTGNGALANLVSQSRINDLVVAFPELTTARIGVSPTWRHGALFARADLGIDIVLDHPSGMNIDPVVHGNVAVGARSGKLSGALELVTIATTGTVDDGQDRFLHTATLGGRYDLGRFSPALAITTGLDDASRGNSIAVTGSMAARF